MQDDVQELLRLSHQLLEAIDRQDWDTYSELCDPSLTCFEPEAGGHLVAGVDFHRFYFEKRGGGGGGASARQSSISSPSVRLIGDAAVVTYVRLVQIYSEGRYATTAAEETRIWERQDGAWRHVHFHRSKPGEIE
jgi:calcium/calmodulin-dependent protein kinase (CaM kinase) II